MKFNLNSLKTLNKKSGFISRVMAVCLLLVICTMNSLIPVQAAPIIDTTTSRTSLIPGAYDAKTSSIQTTTSAQIVSMPGSASTQTVSITRELSVPVR